MRCILQTFRLFNSKKACKFIISEKITPNQVLSEADVKNNPIEQVEKWLDEAIKSEVLEPTAFTFAPRVKMIFLREELFY